MHPADDLRAFFPDWPQHASRIVGRVRDLDGGQLALRASPGHAPIWALAAHVAGARLYWLCGVLGEPGMDRVSFVEPQSGLGWDDDEAHPRSGVELADALETSWSIVESCLGRWTPAMLGDGFERRMGDTVRVHTRASVLNRLFTHDAFHAGEISQLLGVHGLAEIDLWRRPDR